MVLDKVHGMYTMHNMNQPSENPSAAPQEPDASRRFTATDNQQETSDTRINPMTGLLSPEQLAKEIELLIDQEVAVSDKGWPAFKALRDSVNNARREDSFLIRSKRLDEIRTGLKAILDGSSETTRDAPTEM